MMIKDTFEVRPSAKPEAWDMAFESQDEIHIGILLRKEPTGVVFLETDRLCY